MKHLHLDCFAGISGDMMVGALLDLGWPESAMRSALDQLGLQDEFHVHVKRVQRGLIDCVKFDLHSHHNLPRSHGHHGGETQAPHSPDHAHMRPHEHEHGEHTHGRTFREIKALLRASALPEEVKARALAVFERIAVAEGKIHGQPPEDVGFHEVGAADSIGDIVAACCGLRELGIERVSCSPLVEGSGWIQCAHGKFPLPAPATLEILRGIPVKQIDEPGERITPTGAALLAEFACDIGPQPQMRIEKIGYGAGTRDPHTHPNLLRAILGVAGAQAATQTDSTLTTVTEIRCNLDDCTPEVLGSATEKLLAAGALDVSVMPCQMKKNRSGFLLSVLAAEADREKLSHMILQHTTAFGVRWHRCQRLVLARAREPVQTPFGQVWIKIGRLDGRVLQATPEFSSCAEAADRCGVPVREVYKAAERLCSHLET